MRAVLSVLTFVVAAREKQETEVMGGMLRAVEANLQAITTRATRAEAQVAQLTAELVQARVRARGRWVLCSGPNALTVPCEQQAGSAHAQAQVQRAAGMVDAAAERAEQSLRCAVRDAGGVGILACASALLLAHAQHAEHCLVVSIRFEACRSCWPMPSA